MINQYKLEEPLHFYLKDKGFYLEEIYKIVTGEKYTAVMLNNGNIGVCANFGNNIPTEKTELGNPDLNNIKHRILLTAYFNAKLNYENDYSATVDIFEAIDFSAYNNIVMIGLFKPIVERFKANGIPLNVFDLSKSSSDLTSLEKKEEFLSSADAVILTATSIFNNTFPDVIDNTKNGCEIFILGPSATMHRSLLDYKNVTYIFGSVFDKFDERVLTSIENGEGTRKFLKFGKKIFFK